MVYTSVETSFLGASSNLKIINVITCVNVRDGQKKLCLCILVARVRSDQQLHEKYEVNPI